MFTHIVISKTGENKEKRSVTNKSKLFDTNNLKDLYCLMNIDPFPGTKLYKAEIIKKYNISFSNVKIGQDLNFYLKYLSVCNNVWCIPDFLCKKRIVDGSISHQASEDVLDIITSIEEVRKYAKVNNCGMTFLF